MPQFTPVPRDLYKQAEPEAGDILPALTGRMRSRRPFDEFDPDWEYILTGKASVAAVVAALCNNSAEAPEYMDERVFALYCPKAQAMLAANGVSYGRWVSGHCPGDLMDRVAAVANTELGGWAVFAA